MKIHPVVGATLMSLLLATTASAQLLDRGLRDHLMCYKSKVDFAGAGVHLDDVNLGANPGGAHAFAVKKAKDVCVPSQLGEDAILDPNTPLVFYSAKRGIGQCSDDSSKVCKKDTDCAPATCVLNASKFNKKDPRNLSTLVIDQDVDIRLDFTKEIGVLAPADFSATAPAAGSQDFFKCYGVKPTKKSCVNGTSPGEACKEDADCGIGGFCIPNPKFSDTIVTIDSEDALGGETTQQYKKVKMVCQAADKGGEGIVNDGTALMCYTSKQTAGVKFEGATDEISDALGGTGNYELKKRDLHCNPACIGETGIAPTFTQYVLKASSLAIGANGHPGNGLDVDNNPATCSGGFGGCSAGIDNGLASIAGLANMSLQDAVNDGSVILLFEINEFADGAREVAGYIGSQASPAGCTNVNDPAQLCNYNVSSLGLIRNDLCVLESLISLPIDIDGVPTPPNATASGDGGAGSTFVIALSFGGFEFEIVLQNVKIDMDLTHNSSDVTAATGVLAGGIPLANLRAAVRETEGSCVGGTNAGAPCSTDSECNSSDCQLALGQSPEEIATFVTTLVAPDINLDGQNNCQAGSVGVNNFEPCVTAATCPDPSQVCAPNETVSLGLVFNLIDAEIVGVQ